jgi:APA family basic amino acid/polyamine antiporter
LYPVTVIAKEGKASGKLLRVLGVGFGIAVTIGGTIGVGILRTPGLVAAQLPHYWWIVGIWLIGGVYALLGTVSVVELGTMLPEAGGWYAYSRHAFGNYAGFTVGWCDWIAQSTAIAYLGTAIGEFTVTLFPAIPGGIRVVAIGIIIAFALLHWTGIRFSSRAQEITSLIKGIALIGFVAVCFLFGQKNPVPPQHSASPGLIFAIVVALQAIIATYDGWYTAIYFMEEDTNPAKNLPISAISGILSTILIYILVNLGLLYALSIPELASSSLPAATVTQKIFGGSGGAIITALSLLSLLSVINAVLLLAPRILFSMSRDGLFARQAASVHPNGTPVPAMWITTGAAVLLIALGTFEKLLAIAAFFNVLVYLSGFVSLFRLRKLEPSLPRPFRVWVYPWSTLIALFGSLLFLIGNVIGDPSTSAYAFVLILLSYPIYRLVIR